MIVLDTSGLLAALDADQRHHASALEVLESDDGPLLLSPFVLAELDYLLMERVGLGAERALLDEVAAGAYDLVPFGAAEVATAAELVGRYGELRIGLADASVAVIAAAAKTTRLLTLDERHFRPMRPLWGEAFTLLPADGQQVRPVPYGAQVLLRYRYPDGRLQAALPMRVVEDRTDRLVAWLAPQTEIMYWALADGRDPRVVPLGERFRMPLTTAARRWQGTGVLRVIPVQSTYQVLDFWDDDGSFSGWYVNFEAPKARRGTRLDTVDWHLDLWIDAAGVATQKDEDEAQAAVEAGHLSDRNLELAWRTGRQIIEGFSDWRDVVGDWRST